MKRFTLWLALCTSFFLNSPCAHAAQKATNVSFLLSQVRTSTTSLASGKAYFYAAGGTTPKTIWVDRNKQTTANNPYTLDTNGTAQVYADGLYRVVIKDAAGVTKYDRDNLSFVDPTTSGIELNATDYGTDLSSAVTAIGSTPATLVVSDSQSVNANLSIPSTLAIRVIKPGLITIASGKTLTINGPFSAGMYRVFSSPTIAWNKGAVSTISGGVLLGPGAVKEVYPQWWGATGDGVTDDSVAIQAALYSVDSTSKGHRVFVPPGTYITSHSMIIDTNGLTLKGVYGKSIIKRKASVTADTMNLIDTGHEGRYTWGSSTLLYDIKIEDMTFDGNRTNNTLGADDTYDEGLSILYAARTAVRNCIIHDVLRIGIAMSIGSDDSVAEGNTVYNCGEGGIYAEGGVGNLTYNIKFIGNTVKNAGILGMNIGSYSMSRVVGGVMSGNIASGGYVDYMIRNNCNNIAVTGNSSVLPTKYGIWVIDESDAFSYIPTYITITGNTITTGGVTPIRLQLPRYVTISGNTITTTGSYGAEVNNTIGVTFGANTFTGATVSNVRDISGNTVFTLQDESGTWTPTVTGATTAGACSYSSQVGRWTRLGTKRIAFSAFVAWSSHTGTGILQFVLPFAANASDVSLVNVNLYSTTAAYTGQTSGVVMGGTSNVRIWNTNGGTAAQVHIDTDLTTAGSMYISGVYELP